MLLLGTRTSFRSPKCTICGENGHTAATCCRNVYVRHRKIIIAGNVEGNLVQLDQSGLTEYVEDNVESEVNQVEGITEANEFKGLNLRNEGENEDE